MDEYILVTWPESQELMGEDWFNECYLAIPVDENVDGSSVYFVPKHRLEEIKND